jgi:hypothetical protein
MQCTQRRKRNSVPRSPLSTDERRLSRRRPLAILIAVGLVGGPLLVTGSASAITIPGVTGFITNDGRFFVQVGYSQFGYAEYVGNGSDLYASAVLINITGITSSTQVASLQIYSLPGNKTISNLNVPIAGYSSVITGISLPDINAYRPYEVVVDKTPWYFSAFTPYNFLGFTNLQDGGVDLAVFIAIGLFLVYALPLMVKAERMTKRAIYSPKWNATLWLHGIFFGMVAWYFVNFPSINIFFKGWEFVIIPIPEAVFIFFWSAGRHSQNRRALFLQIVPRMGQRLGVIMRDYFVGRDPDGDLVIMRSRSPIQWWYRSRGHHVKIFRRKESGALEPFPLDVLEQARLTEDQIRDPARFPRGAKYDAHDDFPVVNSDESDDFPFERLYFVPRVSAFKVTWPHMVSHRDVPVPEVRNPETGVIVAAHTKKKLCWPRIEDGHAEVTLCSWHFMDVLAQAMGYMTAEDLAAECDNLAIQLWTERGHRHTETSRKADERLLAEEDIRNRPDTDIPEGELDKYVTPLSSRHRDRRGLPGSTGDASG